MGFERYEKLSASFIHNLVTVINDTGSRLTLEKKVGMPHDQSGPAAMEDVK